MSDVGSPFSQTQNWTGSFDARVFVRFCGRFSIFLRGFSIERLLYDQAYTSVHSTSF